MIRQNRPIPAEEIRLLIFDLDGTLVDSRLDLANSVNAMLRHFGKPLLPNEVIAGYIGDGAPMLVRRSLGDPDDEHYVQQALEFFLHYYRAHKLDNTYVYPGIKESLDFLRASRNGHAIKMSVLSNKPVGPSRAIVEALGLGSYFFQVYGGNSFHTKKPDPAGVQALLQESGVPAEQTVIVGDSVVDVLTARNSGAYSLGVSYGFAPHTFADATPDVLVETPEEIVEVFAGNDRQVEKIGK
jgi:phosphoglycolate phosphatase